MTDATVVFAGQVVAAIQVIVLAWLNAFYRHKSGDVSRPEPPSIERKSDG